MVFIWDMLYTPVQAPTGTAPTSADFRVAEGKDAALAPHGLGARAEDSEGATQLLPAVSARACVPKWTSSNSMSFSLLLPFSY